MLISFLSCSGYFTVFFCFSKEVLWVQKEEAEGRGRGKEIFAGVQPAVFFLCSPSEGPTKRGRRRPDILPSGMECGDPLVDRQIFSSMEVHVALREGDGNAFGIKAFLDFFLDVAENSKIIRSLHPGANSKVDAAVG